MEKLKTNAKEPRKDSGFIRIIAIVAIAFALYLVIVGGKYGCSGRSKEGPVIQPDVGTITIE